MGAIAIACDMENGVVELAAMAVPVHYKSSTTNVDGFMFWQGSDADGQTVADWVTAEDGVQPTISDPDFVFLFWSFHPRRSWFIRDGAWRPLTQQDLPFAVGDMRDDILAAITGGQQARSAIFSVLGEKPDWYHVIRFDPKKMTYIPRGDGNV